MNWKETREFITETCIETFDTGDIVFVPNGGDEVEIKGVFTRAHVEISTGDGLPISGNFPVIDVNLAELPSAPTSGDKVRVGDVEYNIIGCEEDGGGSGRLVLQLA